MSTMTPKRDAELRETTSQTLACPRTDFALEFPLIESLILTPTFKQQTLQQVEPPETPTPGNQIIRPQAHVHYAGTSTSWVSTNTQNQARLRRLQGLAAHTGVLKSPFFPKTVMDYTLHLTEWQALVLDKQKKALEQRIMAEDEKEGLDWKLAAWGVEEMGGLGKEKEGVEEEKQVGSKKKVGKCLGGRQLENIGVGTGGFGLTPVLAKVSIWAPGVENKTKVGWPGRDELKFHGQDRVKRGQPRRLPYARTGRLDPREKTYMLKYGGLEGQTEVDLIDKGQTDVPWRKREVVGLGAFDKVRSRSYEKVDYGFGRREWNVAQEKAKAEAGEYGFSGCTLDEKKLRGRTGWAELLDEL